MGEIVLSIGVLLSVICICLYVKNSSKKNEKSGDPEKANKVSKVVFIEEKIKDIQRQLLGVKDMLHACGYARSKDIIGGSHPDIIITEEIIEDTRTEIEFALNDLHYVIEKAYKDRKIDAGMSILFDSKHSELKKEFNRLVNTYGGK